MRSVNSYQDIKTPEDEGYEELVDTCFDELCDIYADEIAEQGMNQQQKASLVNRARQMAKERMEVEACQ